MAEELRYFLRTALWIGGLAVAYWFVSYDPAGTALLVILGIALAAFLVLVAAMEPRTVDHLRPRRHGLLRAPLDTINRVIGFHDPPSEPAPLAGGPDLVPLSSWWPVITAAAFVTIGLGLIYGAWLLVPGVVLLVVGGIGWLTQLDRA